jgi:hypothetical protein
MAAKENCFVISFFYYHFLSKVEFLRSKRYANYFVSFWKIKTPFKIFYKYLYLLLLLENNCSKVDDLRIFRIATIKYNTKLPQHFVIYTTNTKVQEVHRHIYQQRSQFILNHKWLTILNDHNVFYHFRRLPHLHSFWIYF